jgi:hypothetical protein
MRRDGRARAETVQHARMAIKNIGLDWLLSSDQILPIQGIPAARAGDLARAPAPQDGLKKFVASGESVCLTGAGSGRCCGASMRFPGNR